MFLHGTDVAVVADVIERAIKEAMTGRQGTERERGAEVPAAVQRRVTRVLTAPPPLIYSLPATENRTPSFVSENIRELFGYPTDNFQHPNFCRERAQPVTSREAALRFPGFPPNLEYRFRRQDGSYCWVNDPRYSDPRLI
jgi:PAS domain-containing protein